MTDESMRLGERAGEELRLLQDRAIALESREQPDYASLVAGAKSTHEQRTRRARIVGTASAAAALALVWTGLSWNGADAGSEQQLAAVQQPNAQATASSGERTGARTSSEEKVDALTIGEHSTSDEARAFRLAEGRLLLGPRSRVDVREEGEGQRLSLTSGTIELDVDSKQGARVVIARYTIRVTSGALKAAYLLGEEEATLEVLRGSAEVVGPEGEKPRTVGAGERVELRWGGEERHSQAEGPPKASSWKGLAKAGKFREAMDSVESQGFDAQVARLGIEELVHLSDVARMAGRSGRAALLLQKIRARAPGSSHAATAAYSLGTTAFDQQRDYSQAARWFSTYLREAPGGPLGREALGRMMEAQHRSGDGASAKETARRYLSAYPAGPHRPLATKLAGSERP